MSALLPETPRVNRYTQLSGELRRRILEGELKPGDKLPSFTEMRQQFGVSQSTLDRAHSELESEGLIVRRRGAGTFVLNALEANVLPHANGKPAATSFLSRTVAVFTPFAKPVQAHKSGGWLEWIGQGAVNAVQSAGRHVVTLHPDIEADELQSLVRDRPFGVLISAAFQENSLPLELVRRLVQAQIPVVAYGGCPDLLRCDCVQSDHEAGAYALTKLLIQRGRKRILNLCPSGALPFWYEQRYVGYKRACEEAGLTVLPPTPLPDVQQLSASRKIGRQASLRPAPEAFAETQNQSDEEIFRHDVKTCAGHLFEHLHGENAVDALMMVTDRNVFLGAAICRMLRLDPTSDVLITGYDNYFADCEERLLEPFTPLATIDKNNQQIGAAMAQMLFDRIEDRLENGPQTRFVAPSLVVPA